MAAGDEILEFEQWVALSARMTDRCQSDAARVLAEHGVALELFQQSDEHWGDRIADDLARGDMARATVLAARCSEESARRSAEGLAFAKTVDEGGALSGPQLPFQPDAPGKCAPANGGQQRPRAVSASTGTLDAGALPRGAPALPFRREAAPELSLEQYARLRAELAAFPGAEEGIWMRWGIVDTSARDALVQSYKERLSADPESRRRWLDLCAQFNSELTKRGDA